MGDSRAHWIDRALSSWEIEGYRLTVIFTCGGILLISHIGYYSQPGGSIGSVERSKAIGNRRKTCRWEASPVTRREQSWLPPVAFWTYQRSSVFRLRSFSAYKKWLPNHLHRFPFCHIYGLEAHHPHEQNIPLCTQRNPIKRYAVGLSAGSRLRHCVMTEAVSLASFPDIAFVAERSALMPAIIFPSSSGDNVPGAFSNRVRPVSNV